MPPAEPTALLAFDTSTEVMALALQAGATVRTEHLPGGAAASAGLLPAAERLLAEAGIAWSDLDAVAFGRGPGAFTGLRTSCAVAQGLALGLGRPVLAIDSLLVVAEDARRQLGGESGAIEVEVAMDARMGEVYAAAWQLADGRWVVRRPAALMTPVALAAALRRGDEVRYAGSAWAQGGPAAALGVPTARIIAGVRDRAAALLALALDAWRAGAGADAAEALPVYLRDKVALTTQERAAA